MASFFFVGSNGRDFLTTFAWPTPFLPVDLLFDEDTAFWPALAQVSQKAKCPIVLTSTSELAELSNFRYKSIALDRPSPRDCGLKMAQVAKEEGMRFDGGLDTEETSRRLSLIAEVFRCDMRKILNEMQLFHFADTSKRSTTSASTDRAREVDMKNFGCVSTAASSAGEVVVDVPQILGVEPRLVPRDRHTLITITGCGFSASTLPAAQYNKGVAAPMLFIGGKECHHFRIVSDEKIIAVCPPIDVPSGVTKDLIYEQNKDVDCFSCKFVQLAIHKTCSNGLVLDSSSVFCNAKMYEPTAWTAEYDMQLRDGAWGERASREDLRRKLKARKQQQAQETDELMSSDEENEIDTKLSSSSADSEVRDQWAVSGDEIAVNDKPEATDIDPRTLLENAISETETIKELDTTKETVPPVDQVVPALQLDAFANELSLLSDAVLLEDSFSTLAIPSLAGPVEGFGAHAVEPSSTADPTIDKLCKGTNKKP